MARPDPKFDLDSLIETEAVTAEQAEIFRIVTAQILDRDLNHRRVWLDHAFDVRRVQNAVKRGHFEAWVGSLPFSRSKAFAWAAAAKILTEYLDEIGSPNFGLLPPMNSTVVCELARSGVDQEIRKRFLGRLVAGDTVTRAELHEALGKVKPEPQPEPEQESEPALEEEPPKREPTPAMERFARRMMARDRRFILDIARSGELQLLLDALSWADVSSAGFGERALADDEADRLDERVADAMREMPRIKPPEMGEAGNDDEDTDVAPKKKIVH